MNIQEAIEYLNTCEVDATNERWCEAMRIVRDAAYKQIPRRPHLPEIDAEYICPSCKEILVGGEYCSDCGQKLDLG